MALASASAPKRPSADHGPGARRPDEAVRDVPLPGGGTVRERSDLRGRPTVQEWPDGSWIRFAYDLDGRLKRVEDSSGESITYAFDPDQRTWTARTRRTETTIRLGPDELPCGVDLRVDGHAWSVEYERDERGRPTALRYPETRELVRYERGVAGLAIACGQRVYGRISAGDGQQVTAEYETGARTVETLTADVPHRAASVQVIDAGGATVVSAALDRGAEGRLTRTGSHRFGYDGDGRLVASVAGPRSYRFAYDGDGRLIERRGPGGRRCHLLYDGRPTVARVEPVGRAAVSFRYDALGRRSERHGPDGVTRYGYDLLGLLDRVELPDGDVVRYAYDGFGRLVAREDRDGSTYYITGMEGERLAEAGPDGRVRVSYLWLGRQCVGWVDGPIGGPLAGTLHRAPGWGSAAVGDAAGVVEAPPDGDPFGLDTRIDERRPGYAGLFGDPATGLLFASSRWLDPETTQFLTPDSWFGADPARGLPPALRRTLRALPGGTQRLLNPVTAYAWSAYDPVNFSDPSGHNWLGLIYSFISAFLWEMQLTSLALQMEVINILLEPFNALWHLITWNGSGWWKWSIFNLAPPVASYRLMVPFAILLNGLLKIHEGRAWTLGSIIWEEGSDLRDIAAKAKRDVLICSNAGDYVAKADQVAADVFRARSPHVRITGTVTNIGSATAPVAAPQVTTTVVAPAPGVTLSDILGFGDWVSVRTAAVPTDELRWVTNVAAPSLSLAQPPLPAAFAAQPVTITRLDSAVLRLRKGDTTAARSVQFVRGNTFHFRPQLPDGFPTDGLDVAEFMPAGKPERRTGATFPIEPVVVRLAQTSDRTSYAVNNVVRLLAAGGGAAAGASPYHMRKIASLPRTVDVELDSPLPSASYATAEVVRLDSSGSPIAGQGAAGATFDRVAVTGLAGLQRFDGLELFVPAAPTAIERRIAVELLVDGTVAALPAALHNVAVKVDRLVVDGGPADGTMVGATGKRVKVTTAGASFDAGKPVQIKRSSDGRLGFGVVKTFSGGVLEIVDAIPAADFGAGVAVQVTRLTAFAELAAENVVPPGDHVLIRVDTLTSPVANDIVRIRLASADDGGAVRQLTAVAPFAKLDSALPASHQAGLTVQRFAPDNATKRSNATIPSVRRKLVLKAGDANTYAQGQDLLVTGAAAGDEAVVSVGRPPSGQDVFLTIPADLPANSFAGAVKIVAVAPTGKSTADGKLDEGVVLIPSESDVGKQLTRREALENHEMRHVWQGAVWGAFIIAMPIPWLFHLGWSFGSQTHPKSQIVRHVGLGGIDSFFAWIVYAAKGSPDDLVADARVAGPDRTRLVLDAGVSSADVARFEPKSRISVKKGDDEFFNVVDALDEGSRTITLRFSLDQPPISDGDGVKVVMSPYEQIRRSVNTFFSLNLEQLWSDHIPTAWVRALSRLLNRDSWFPFLGIYLLIGLLQVGKKEYRLPNEQDAAYHSGDLYTDLGKADPNVIHVGHITRAWSFIQARTGGLASRGDANRILRVALPAGVSATDVAGAVPTVQDAKFTPARDCIVFRETHMLDLDDRVENAVGAFFIPSKAGDYHVRPPDTRIYDEGMAFPRFAFAVGFFDLAKVTVKPLPITPDPTRALFETEAVPFAINVGDSKVSYALRFPPGGASLGTINGLRYAAPLVTGAGPVTQDLQVFATYAADHPIFFLGEDDQRRNASHLTPAQLTNFCQTLSLTINKLTLPAIGPVVAGKTAEFDVPITPATQRVTSPTPAGATVNATVSIVRTGRPTRARFVAPAGVTAATNVTVEFTFGSDPDPAKNRVLTTTVQVTPAPTP